LAHITYKLQKGKSLHPIIIIYEDSPIILATVEIQKTGKLGPYACLVVCQGSFVQQIAFVGLPGRIPDHPGGPTDQGVGLMSGQLKMSQHHYSDQMPDMKRIC